MSSGESLERALAICICLPGQYLIVTSYGCKHGSSRCSLGVLRSGFFNWIDSRGLWSDSVTKLNFDRRGRCGNACIHISQLRALAQCWHNVIQCPLELCWQKQLAFHPTQGSSKTSCWGISLESDFFCWVIVHKCSLCTDGIFDCIKGLLICCVPVKSYVLLDELSQGGCQGAETGNERTHVSC